METSHSRYQLTAKYRENNGAKESNRFRNLIPIIFIDRTNTCQVLGAKWYWFIVSRRVPHTIHTLCCSEPNRNTNCVGVYDALTFIPSPEFMKYIPFFVHIRRASSFANMNIYGFSFIFILSSLQHLHDSLALFVINKYFVYFLQLFMHSSMIFVYFPLDRLVWLKFKWHLALKHGIFATMCVLKSRGISFTHLARIT